MKLYTEEQVRKAFKEGNFDFMNDTSDINFFINSLIPIELPSDEEIAERAIDNSAGMFGKSLFEEGAEWMKKQILNQNK